jgi:arylsulfatase A-like enzyme
MRCILPLCALAAAAACGPPAPPRARQVLVLSLDTLRADHLSLYGYERATSPALEALAREATLYTRAQAAAPWTLPSHASMFTGLYPYEHGAHTWPIEDLAALADRGWNDLNNVGPLEPHHLTLAEAFAQEGFATGAIVANMAFMDARFGVAQGFDDYDQGRAPVDDVSARALAWIDAHAEEPFFLFVNYMDTHRPYNCTPRDGAWPSGAEHGNVLVPLTPLVLDLAEEVPPELLTAAVDQYDTAIANLDEGLGRLFDALRARGHYDDMLIVVTSDHGEYLGEHRLLEHSKDVYQGALHVPLLVKTRGQSAPAVDDELISHVHLAGLVLEHSDVDPPAAARARLTQHWPRGAVHAENYYTRVKDLRSPWGARFDRVRRVRFDGPLKYIDSSDGAHELYDLAADPREETNRVARPPAGADLARALQDWLARRAPAPRPGLVESDAAHQAELAASGYAGGGDSDDE